MSPADYKSRLGNKNRSRGSPERDTLSAAFATIDQILRPFRDIRPQEGYLYTANHLWLKPGPSQSWRIGLDEIASRLLAHVHEVIFPASSRLYAKRSYLLWINHSVGMVSIRAPLPVFVLAVNPTVRQEPHLLLAEPLQAGWLLEGHLSPEEGEHAIIPGPLITDWWQKDIDWLTDTVKEHIQRELDTGIGETLPDGGKYLYDLPNILGPSNYRELLQHVMELD